MLVSPALRPESGHVAAPTVRDPESWAIREPCFECLRRPRNGPRGAPWSEGKGAVLKLGRCGRLRLLDDSSCVILSVMKEISAVDLRQSLRRLAKELEQDGEPILLTVGRRPVGVIVSMSDFRERFALKVAEEERLRLVEEILGDKGIILIRPPPRYPSGASRRERRR